MPQNNLHPPAQRERSADSNVLFRRLLSDYQQALYWHIRHIVGTHEDAEDALQETFVRAYRNMDSLREASSERAWLYRIATNEALRHVENRKTTLDIEDHQLAADTPADDPHTTLHDYDNLQQALAAAIETLPARQRAVFSMRYYDELSYEDIARIVDSNVKAVTANFHVAKEKIKQYLLAL